MWTYRPDDPELVHFAAFWEVEEDLPDGDLFDDPPDSSPDYRVDTGKDVLGVEHTRIYQQHDGEELPRQALETYIPEVIREAEEEYKSRRNPHVHVNVHFSSDAYLGKDMIEEVARELVGFVEQRIPEPGEKARFSDLRGDRNLPKQIWGLSILRFEEAVRTSWSHPDTVWVSQLTPEYVQERINAKNGKVASYRENCDRIWLLLVFNGTLSTSFDIGPELPDHTFESDFDRTYLFDFENEESLLLRTE